MTTRHMPGKFNRKVIAILMVVAGSICLLAAAGWFVYSWHLVATSTRATGQITELIERPDGKGDTFFYPVFTYTDPHGIEHRIYSSVGSYPPPHRVGETVTVLYIPGSEQNAQIDDWSFMWSIPLLLVFLGVFNTSVGGVLFLWGRKGGRV